MCRVEKFHVDFVKKTDNDIVISLISTASLGSPRGPLSMRREQEVACASFLLQKHQERVEASQIVGFVELSLVQYKARCC